MCHRAWFQYEEVLSSKSEIMVRHFEFHVRTHSVCEIRELLKTYLWLLIFDMKHLVLKLFVLKFLLLHSIAKITEKCEML